MNTRVEKDTMGEFNVPVEALYGAQTARAVANFPVSGQGIGREMIRALGLIKGASAQVNEELGKLDAAIAKAIVEAASEVADGVLDAHFPVDVFQTGSGTSSNMNANEVISNRAIQLLGGVVGSKVPVHPNDHVNMGQSSNDVFPTAIHVAAATGIEKRLLPVLKELEASLKKKSVEFDGIVKIGRTHLQDATPIRLGQEFSGFASQIEHGIEHIEGVLPFLYELAIGGTAVGTGINTHVEFGSRVARKLESLVGLPFTEARNHFEAQAARDACVRVSGALRALSVSLIKIANDIRWLGSGPRLGLGELKLPEVQPGSSIMPGKVNPVIAESIIQVATQVIGNDAAIGAGGMFSQLQLNTMQPLIARNLLEQIRLLSEGVRVFQEKLVDGLMADEARIEGMYENSMSLATALAPQIGYEQAAAIAKQSVAQKTTVREIVRTLGIMDENMLEKLLDPRRQTDPEKG